MSTAGESSISYPVSDVDAEEHFTEAVGRYYDLTHDDDDDDNTAAM